MEELKIKIKKINNYNIIIHENTEMISFYLQKKGYGLINFCIGITKNPKIDIEKFIAYNLHQWISFYNEDLEKIEKV